MKQKNTPLYYSHLDRSQVEFLAKSSAEKNATHDISHFTNFNRVIIFRCFRLFGEHVAIFNESHTANIFSGKCELC